jgi:hypothetical protein
MLSITEWVAIDCEGLSLTFDAFVKCFISQSLQFGAFCGDDIPLSE